MTKMQTSHALGNVPVGATVRFPGDDNVEDNFSSFQATKSHCTFLEMDQVQAVPVLFLFVVS